MSRNDQLTWDNLDSFIDSLPKDDKGHFLPNPRANEKLVLSTTNDSWVDPSSLVPPTENASVDLPLTWENLDPKKDLVSTVSDWFAKTFNELTEGFNDIHDKVVDVLVDDGFIKDPELWKKNLGVNINGKVAVLVCDGGRIEVRFKPTNAPNESVVKLINCDVYCIAFPFAEPADVVETESNKVVEESFKLLGKTLDNLPETNAGESLLSTIKTMSDESKEALDSIQAMRYVEENLGQFLIDNIKFISEGGLKKVAVSQQSDGSFISDVKLINGDEATISFTIPLDREQMSIKHDRKLPEVVRQNPILEKAKANLETLNVEEAEKEFETQLAGMQRAAEIKKSGLLPTINSPLTNPNMTPEQLKEWSARNIEKAKAIIGTMDTLLEEGGRVNVADKQLMNCKADLNQLIPFKYQEPWVLYLSSCSNHWMPGEMNLERSVPGYVALDSDSKRLMARAYFTQLSRCNLFPESSLLNMYRMISNPECRQYMLRQGQESVTVKHAWMDIEETLNIKGTLIDGVKLSKAFSVDDHIFKQRHRDVMGTVSFVHDFTSETGTAEQLAEFIKCFIIQYTYSNWLMPLVANYQVIAALENTDSCHEIRNILHVLNKDGVGQFEFAKFFIKGVVAENPHILTEKWIKDVRDTLHHLVIHDLALVTANRASENAVDDVGYICNYYIDEIMCLIDSSHQRTPMKKESQRGVIFVNNLNNIAPDTTQAAGLGGFQW